MKCRTEKELPWHSPNFCIAKLGEHTFLIASEIFLEKKRDQRDSIVKLLIDYV